MQMTLAQFGKNKLRRLCQELQLSRQLTPAIDIFNLMSESWFTKPLGKQPIWKNDITDDGTPFEFSVAFSKAGPMLRMLFESQQFPTTPSSSWRAGLRFNDRIKNLKGVNLERFDQISDLFTPTDKVPSIFSLWHAVNFGADGTPEFKIYLNPHVRGDGKEKRLLKEALLRLEMPYAWDFLEPHMRPSNFNIFLSLDLSQSKNARVKIYSCHSNATNASIEALGHGCQDYVAGDATRWINRVNQGKNLSIAKPLTHFSFTGANERPKLTVYVPVRCYGSTDLEILKNAKNILPKSEYVQLRNAVTQMTHRPLDAGSGLITYVSTRRDGPGENITFYLAPEAYSFRAAQI